MSVLRFLQALESVDEGFFSPNFFSIPGNECGRVADGLHDPFFNSIRQRPGFPLNLHPFSSRSGSRPLPTLPGASEGLEDVAFPRMKYSFLMKKKASFGSAKRGIVSLMKGQARSNGSHAEESLSYRKKIDRSSLRVKRLYRYAQEEESPYELKTELKGLSDEAEEQHFLNDWSLFGPFEPLSFETISEPSFPPPLALEPFESFSLETRLQKLEAMDPSRRAKKEAALRAKMVKWSERATRRREKRQREDTTTPSDFEFTERSIRKIQLGRTRCILILKRRLTNSGQKEKYTITKILAKRKVSLKWKTHLSETVKVQKKYKNVTEETEAKFIRDYNDFLGIEDTSLYPSNVRVDVEENENETGQDDETTISFSTNPRPSIVLVSFIGGMGEGEEEEEEVIDVEEEEGEGEESEDDTDEEDDDDEEGGLIRRVVLFRKKRPTEV